MKLCGRWGAAVQGAVVQGVVVQGVAVQGALGRDSWDAAAQLGCCCPARAQLYREELCRARWGGTAGAELLRNIIIDFRLVTGILQEESIFRV